MAFGHGRLARVVVEGCPWHITQRGNCRSETFFSRDDGLVNVKPLLDLVRGWQTVLSPAAYDKQAERFRRHARTGRPLGDENFVARLSKRLGRALSPKKRGPKPKLVGELSMVSPE
ncbi:MAG: hypothetical protein ABIG44_15640 [Planctomycetota bacterium]